MSKICGRCKNVIDDNAVFCQFCGGRVYEGRQPENSQQVQPQQTVQQEQPFIQGQTPYNQTQTIQKQEMIQNPSNDKDLQMLSLVISALVVLVPFLKLLTINIILLEERISVWGCFELIDDLGGLDKLEGIDIFIFLGGIVCWLFIIWYIVNSIKEISDNKKGQELWRTVASASIMAVALLGIIVVFVFIVNFSGRDSEDLLGEKYKLLEFNTMFYVIAVINVVNCFKTCDKCPWSYEKTQS